MGFIDMKNVLRKFDLVCLGGGPAGIPCARKAAAYGKKVCIIEQDRLGGTCLNRGCTPKKIFHHAAELISDARNAGDFGIWTKSKDKKHTDITFDWSVLQSKNQQFVQMINQMVGGMCQKMGISVMKGVGKFVNPHTIALNNGKEEIHIQGDEILVATGSKPVMPKISGIEYAVTSDKFFEMMELPKSIAIIGGGYIGVEIANCLNTFNVKTSVCMLEKNILPSFDYELAKIEMEYMKKKGILFYPETEISEIEKISSSMYKVITKDGKATDIEAEMVMMAVGRKPNTEGFDFEKAGVTLAENGAVKVNEYDQTTTDHIFCVGDATGKIMLTTVARTASKLLADRLFGPGKIAKDKYLMDYTHVPSAVFSEPPLARIGLTESEAILKFSQEKTRVYKHEGFQLCHALTQHKDPFNIKIVCEVVGDTERVVGMHCLGRNADEIISGFSVAMRHGSLTKRDLEKSIAIHPSGAEEIFNLFQCCLLYTSPSPRDATLSRMPSSA
eukprot:TRINITY_DN2768_c0_g1_i1.p1 TRINITY_DN2768_c0_g1~~TRINITY_DN2768_c0_g1_i1.p1  ORF type:complete len:501 (-),score=110.43 TRINITY_DN2768_c0_g1_i1:14-1516(-)